MICTKLATEVCAELSVCHVHDIVLVSGVVTGNHRRSEQNADYAGFATILSELCSNLIICHILLIFPKPANYSENYASLIWARSIPAEWILLSKTY